MKSSNLSIKVKFYYLHLNKRKKDWGKSEKLVEDLMLNNLMNIKNNILKEDIIVHMPYQELMRNGFIKRLKKHKSSQRY